LESREESYETVEFNAPILGESASRLLLDPRLATSNSGLNRKGFEADTDKLMR
jgi:hypothetical protein